MRRDHLIVMTNLKHFPLMLLVLAPCISGRRRDKPHIVLIVADDLGYNDVPWHNPTIFAPHLLDLAKDGVILEQNYVQPKCSPSRAALMTGIFRL